MDLQLEGRRALVTGASRGLGRAIAVALAAEGVDVIAVSRNPDRAPPPGTAAGAARGTLTSRRCDLADATAIDALGDVLETTDILVINTGGPPPGPISAVADSVWLGQFESLFLPAVRLTRGALPGMRRRGFGRILVVVSSGVLQPLENLGISNALRLSLVGWAKTLSAEVAGDGVTVNCIAPGRIATDRVAELDRGRARREGIDVAEVERQSRATIPLGRYGDPGEFAVVAAFLASPRAGYMTGGIVRVDGGLIRSV
jgi:3-oxoacyl-[acyl-carrier protein] reductase